MLNNHQRKWPVFTKLKEDYCLISRQPLESEKIAVETIAKEIYYNAKTCSIAVFFDEYDKPLYSTLIGEGFQNNVSFRIRRLIQAALLGKAKSVSVVYNLAISEGKQCHPITNKKNYNFCNSDIKIFQEIQQLCNLFEIKLNDIYAIIGLREDLTKKAKPVYYSMKEKKEYLFIPILPIDKIHNIYPIKIKDTPFIISKNTEFILNDKSFNIENNNLEEEYLLE